MGHIELQQRYLERVYAGVLGKIIGVYMGRPFEGWSRQAIEERLGEIDRYVAAELGKELVVADDDISGTFTFIRALEDSGRYAATDSGFIGDTWLNYLIEGRTVLWWGGLGHSTEHTAWLRLSQGIRAPASGSIAHNGRVVAEQIGAQIFIDAFGLVCPGEPALAAELAARSARVSHDGEAVLAAQVVAAMVAAAFDESDLQRLMDIGVAQIPSESLIAQVHRDVRAWAREDGDWRRTWERIDQRYGYQRYGGNCHVIPNHALMVLAWSYAPDDFHRAQLIVNTAGWDTDCNAANVGCVMGVALGLEAIDARYDFRGPIAERILLPTADGTRTISDALTEARHVVAIGRRIMGWPAEEPTAWQDFALPGSVQGWQGCGETPAHCANRPHPQQTGRRCLTLQGASAGARAETPLFASSEGGYAVIGCPRLRPGGRVRLRIAGASQGLRCRLGLRFAEAEQQPLWSGPLVAQAGSELLLDWPPERQALALALQLELLDPGELEVESLALEGRALLELPTGFIAQPGGQGKEALRGWLCDGDLRLRGAFSDDAEPQTRIGRDRGRALVVTGGRDWGAQRIGARMNIHLAADCGLVVRYQGRERWIALLRRAEDLILLRRHYGEETILARHPAPAWPLDELHRLELAVEGSRYRASCDGQLLFELDDASFASGAAGITFADGMIGVRDLRIEAELAPRLALGSPAAGSTGEVEKWSKEEVSA